LLYATLFASADRFALPPVLPPAPAQRFRAASRYRAAQPKALLPLLLSCH